MGRRGGRGGLHQLLPQVHLDVVEGVGGGGGGGGPEGAVAGGRRLVQGVEAQHPLPPDLRLQPEEESGFTVRAGVKTRLAKLKKKLTGFCCISIYFYQINLYILITYYI